MVNLTRGITLGADDEVTDVKMESGIESATVADIARADLSQTDTSVFISTVAPIANPVPIAGHLWYDTTNAILRMYDGTLWQPVSRGYIYTNKSGVTLTTGEVVVIDTGNASSVTRTTTLNDLDVFGVVLDGAVDDADVIVITEGFVPVLDVTGSTAIGDYLTTSTTAGKAVNTTNPRSGTFGIALTTSAVSVKAQIGGSATSVISAGLGFSAVDSFAFTKDASTPTGTTVVTHNLGVVPSMIYTHAFFAAGGGGNENHSSGIAVIVDSSTIAECSGAVTAGSGDPVAISGYSFIVGDAETAYMRGTITAVTVTNFTITWSEVGAVGGSVGNFTGTVMA